MFLLASVKHVIKLAWPKLAFSLQIQDWAPPNYVGREGNFMTSLY